jgi:hypothetical protein
VEYAPRASLRNPLASCSFPALVNITSIKNELVLTIQNNAIILENGEVG